MLKLMLGLSLTALVSGCASEGNLAALCDHTEQDRQSCR